MEPVTTYTSSDGTITPIAELNTFHLVNALLKVTTEIARITTGMSGFDEGKAVQKALKDEIFKRLDNRPAQA